MTVCGGRPALAGPAVLLAALLVAAGTAGCGRREPLRGDAAGTGGSPTVSTASPAAPPIGRPAAPPAAGDVAAVEALLGTVSRIVGSAETETKAETDSGTAADASAPTSGSQD